MAALEPTVGATGASRAANVRLPMGLRWLLVLVYAWSAGGKFFWPERFREILLGAGMIPEEILTPLAYGLPAIEVLLAAALAARLLLPVALLVSTFLSTVFAGIHGYLVASGELVPCGCAGVAIDFSSQEWHISLLALSVAMALASVALLFAPSRTRRSVLHLEGPAGRLP